MNDSNDSKDDIENCCGSQNVMEIDNEFPNKTNVQNSVNVELNNDYKTKEKDEQNSFTDVDALLFELSSKYAIKERTNFEIDPKPQVSKPKPMIFVTLSDSEEDSSNKYLNLNAGPSKTLNCASVFDSDDEASKTKTTKKSPKLPFQEMTKEKIAAAKKAIQEKRVQRIFKKAEELKAKEMKKKLNQASKNLKPDEYVNQIQVVICDLLSGKPMSKEIFNLLNENDIKYSKTSQIYANSITWNRTIQYHKMDDEELITTTKTEDCEIILFILECDDLMAMIVQDELIEHFKTIKETMHGKVITLGIFAVNDYFRGSKNQRKRNFKNNIYRTKNKVIAESELLDGNIIETYLTKLQILLSICYKYLDTAHDVAALVNHMTKAIAQTPYKLKRNEQMEQAQNYMIGDNKDCVLVDKNGNGLSRLWQQNITSFPIARLDLAESVMATYPTFNSLMQAYESCDDFIASEKLLENLEIRRTAGPLTNFRKIGPEFSKKIFRYYNSRDPDMLL